MTTTFPTSFPQFARQFASEDACWDFLVKTRWPDGFVCPKCGAGQRAFLASRRLFRCANRHQISVTAGTSLHRTKIPLQTWFYAAWLVCTMKPGVSALQFQRQLGLSRYETTWMMLHKFRAALFNPERHKLSGEIEVDEKYVGGRESVPGRGAKTKTLVASAVEVHRWTDKKGKAHAKAGRCRLQVIPNSRAETLLDFITRNAEVGSTIVSDGLSSYEGVRRLGYHHNVVVASRTADPLPVVGRVHSNLDSWLIGTHKRAVRRQHLQAYLNEYTFRFNRRADPWFIFRAALGFAMQNRAAATYDGIEKHGWRHPNPDGAATVAVPDVEPWGDGCSAFPPRLLDADRRNSPGEG